MAFSDIDRYLLTFLSKFDIICLGPLEPLTTTTVKTTTSTSKSDDWRAVFGTDDDEDNKPEEEEEEPWPFPEEGEEKPKKPDEPKPTPFMKCALPYQEVPKDYDWDSLSMEDGNDAT